MNKNKKMKNVIVTSLAAMSAFLANSTIINFDNNSSYFGEEYNINNYGEDEMYSETEINKVKHINEEINIFEQAKSILGNMENIDEEIIEIIDKAMLKDAKIIDISID